VYDGDSMGIRWGLSHVQASVQAADEDARHLCYTIPSLFIITISVYL